MKMVVQEVADGGAEAKVGLGSLSSKSFAKDVTNCFSYTLVSLTCHF